MAERSWSGTDQRTGNDPIAMHIILFLIGTAILFGNDPQNLDPSFEFNYTDTEINVDPDSVGSFSGTIHNISSGTITIAVVRRVNSLPEGWTSSVCLGSICYIETVDSAAVQLDAGDSTACGILAWTNGVGTGTVQLDLFDLDNIDEHILIDLIIYAGITVGPITTRALPEHFELYDCFPNPFNPITTLRYELPEDAMVSITIYDMMGRQVKTLINDQQTAGYRSLQWNATNYAGSPVSAGIYLYMIQAGDFRQTKKIVLLK